LVLKQVFYVKIKQ